MGSVFSSKRQLSHTFLLLFLRQGLTMQGKLALNSQNSSLHSLPSAKKTGVWHRT